MSIYEVLRTENIAIFLSNVTNPYKNAAAHLNHRIFIGSIHCINLICLRAFVRRFAPRYNRPLFQFAVITYDEVTHFFERGCMFVGYAYAAGFYAGKVSSLASIR